jgi:hypothetical protein
LKSSPCFFRLASRLASSHSYTGRFYARSERLRRAKSRSFDSGRRGDLRSRGQGWGRICGFSGLRGESWGTRRLRLVGVLDCAGGMVWKQWLLVALRLSGAGRRVRGIAVLERKIPSLTVRLSAAPLALTIPRGSLVAVKAATHAVGSMRGWTGRSGCGANGILSFQLILRDA